MREIVQTSATTTSLARHSLTTQCSFAAQPPGQPVSGGGGSGPVSGVELSASGGGTGGT
jgi:hypothetical protein